MVENLNQTAVQQQYILTDLNGNNPLKLSTIIGDGTNPGNATIAPGAAITDLDAFTFVTDSGTDSVTAATVTLAAGTAAGLSEVRITSDNGSTTYFTAVSNPASDTVNFSGGTAIPVTTTSTQFKVRITPKSHANMPAGSEYAVTGTITSFTSTNAQAGTDSASATLTIDNLSPGNVTGASATPGYTQVTVSWTNPGDADISNLVVLRNTATISDVPAEGSSSAIDDTIGTSVVRYIASGTSFIDTGLIDTTYYYRIFAKDTNGNYAATGVEVSATPSVTITWDGSESTDWDTAGNWDQNDVPTSAVTVVIPSGPSNQPILGSVTTVNNLTINSGASLTLAGNNLTVSSTFTNNGTLILQGGETVSGPTNNSGSLVKYNGTAGPYTLQNWSYDSLQLSSASATTYNLPATLTINANLTIDANNTLDMNAISYAEG